MKNHFNPGSLLRKTSIFLLLASVSLNIISQTYITRNGMVRFFSEAPLENIEAVNRQVSCALDAATGEIVFRVVIRSFVFEKALMQEHFNDNFMESQQYPNSTYEGKILNIDRINFNSDGIYDVISEGKLTIKNVTKEINTKGKMTIKGNTISGSSKFSVRPAEYNIQVPSRFMRNIAEEIDVYVEVILTKR